MSALFSGLGANKNPKIVYFWNEGQQKNRNTSPKFTNNLQKCINSRPDLSNVLSANVGLRKNSPSLFVLIFFLFFRKKVYADVEGRNRLIGTATFGIMELLSGMPLKKEVRRWTTPGKANYVCILLYNLFDNSVTLFSTCAPLQAHHLGLHDQRMASRFYESPHR